LGTAIEPVALGATPAPLAASFPSKSATDSAAQQPRAAAVAAKANAAAQTVTSEMPPPAATQAVIDSINAELLTAGKSIQLSVDSESDRSVVIVRDTRTGAVIGQFPAEQALRLQSLLASHPHLLVDLTA
jgi:uncharacterized FlaG/YvyC family protein